MGDAHRDEATAQGVGAPTGVSRRTFLKGVGVGVVAAGLSTYRPAGASAAASQSPSAAPPVDLADAVETWLEPPVWDPDGARQLVQKVVGDTNGFRFSYDGASPGPTIRMRGDETLYRQHARPGPRQLGAGSRDRFRRRVPRTRGRRVHDAQG